MDFSTLTQTCEPGKASIEILLVDEHLIFREGLRRILEAESDFLVVGDARGADDAARVVDELKPDVLITGLSGRTLIRMMQTLRELTTADVRTIVLAPSIEKTHMVQALQLGVSGILSKDTSSQVLFDSVRNVAAGECWVGRERLPDLLESLRHPNAAGEQSKKTRFGLTPRELEIVAAVSRGETNKVMARKLTITEDTVKHHLTHIFAKIGVFTRLELAVFAIKHGLNQPPAIAFSAP